MENLLNSNEHDVLVGIAESLREIRKWARVTGFPTVKVTLESVLNTDEKKIVYHLCDGNRSAKDIASLSKVNIRFVSEWGQAWEAIGILGQSQSTTIKGRRQKIFELSDFGIQIPDKFAKQAEVNENDHVT